MPEAVRQSKGMQKKEWPLGLFYVSVATDLLIPRNLSFPKSRLCCFIRLQSVLVLPNIKEQEPFAKNFSVCFIHIKLMFLRAIPQELAVIGDWTHKYMMDKFYSPLLSSFIL